MGYKREDVMDGVSYADSVLAMSGRMDPGKRPFAYLRREQV